jgi:hypothetical protein
MFAEIADSLALTATQAKSFRAGANGDSSNANQDNSSNAIQRMIEKAKAELTA